MSFDPKAQALAAKGLASVSRQALGLAAVGSRNPWQVCATRQNSMANASSRDGGLASDKGRIQRVQHVACGDLTAIRLKYSNTYNGSNGETANTNPVVVVASVEYPLGSCYPVSFGGAQAGRIDGGFTLLSDEVGVSIPKGATFWTRTFATCAIPPTLAVAAGTGGALTAATYYYRATALTDTGESGGSVEQSAVVSASGTATLTLTENNFTAVLPVRGYKVYRSSSAGAEVYLTTLPAYTTSWVDTGAISIGAGSVPAQQFVPRGIQLSQTLGSEGQLFTVSTLTQLTATSPGFSSVNSTAFSPCAIFGLSQNLPPWVALSGDSIISGTGDAGYSGRLAGDAGFAVRALDAALIPHISISQGGETLVNFQGLQRQNRLPRLIGAKHIICNYGTNSLGSVSVANMKAAILEIASAFINSGAKAWWCTLNPKTTSTNNFTAASDQTPLNTTDGVDATYNTPELRRLAVNAWLRDASGAGFVSQAGGAGVAGVFDVAATVEVDTANALNSTGGRYICAAGQNVANYGTTDGTHPSTAGHQLMQAAIVAAALA